MNKSDRALMQKALETFEAYASVHQWVNARSLEVMYALRDRLAQPEPQPAEVPCKDHPDAPHGFDRNASHSEDRYVCECEYWEPPKLAQPDWVGLTDEEVYLMKEYPECCEVSIRKAEAKLKEKNRG